MAFIYHCLESITMLQKLCKIHFVDFSLENYLLDNLCVTRGDEWQSHVGIIQLLKKNLKTKLSNVIGQKKKRPFKKHPKLSSTRMFFMIFWRCISTLSFQHWKCKTVNNWPMPERQEIKLTGIFTSQAEQHVKKQTSSLQDLIALSFDCLLLKGAARLNGALGQY